jgi:hypothetical protein
VREATRNWSRSLTSTAAGSCLTVHTLLKRGEIRAFRSDEEAYRDMPKWVYIPLDDVYAYGERVGRRVRGS